MRFSAPSLRLLFVLLVAGCVFASGAGASAGKRAALGESLAVGSPGNGAKACAKRAGRVGRLLSSRGRTATAARRASVRQRRRCLARLRRAAMRKRATVSTLTTQARGNLVIGIDGGYTGWSDSEIAQRKELGAAVTRHEWDPLDPVDEQDEEVLIAAAEIHTRIHALLGANDLGDPGHYRDWVVGFIRRYGLGGSFWAEHPELDEAAYAIRTVELGNEPYFGTMSAEEYATTVQPTLEEIERLGLPVQVVLPSRVYGKDTSWMDTLYERIPNLNDLFYAFAEHPYWYGHDPAEVDAAGPFGRIDAARRRMNELGASTKPIFITEYGESTADCGEECIDEATQAAHLRQMIEAVIARPEWGVKMLSVFQLRDRGTHSSDRELQFGMLRQDGSAKPSYGLVRAAMQQYRG